MSKKKSKSLPVPVAVLDQTIEALQTTLRHTDTTRAIRQVLALAVADDKPHTIRAAAIVCERARSQVWRKGNSNLFVTAETTNEELKQKAGALAYKIGFDQGFAAFAEYTMTLERRIAQLEQLVEVLAAKKK